MQAVYLPAPQHIEIIEQPEPTPQAGEVVIRVVAAGICANDVSLITGNNSIGKFPIIPGHECIGVVQSIGTNVELELGTWVTVYPSVGCGNCQACLEGRINHCPDFRVLGIDLDSGCFAEKIVVRHEQLLPVPVGLRQAQGALIEPSAVAVHVNKRGQTKTGNRVMVIGAGVIGLLTAMVARALGASQVVLIDRLETRRAICTELGFTEFYCVPDDLKPEALTSICGSAFDLVFDTVCNNATTNAGLQTLLPGSTFVLVATPKSKTVLEINFPLLYKRELSLVVSRNYVPQDFFDAMQLIESGQINLAPLITANYSLQDFPKAVHALQTQPEAHIKILIHP